MYINYIHSISIFMPYPDFNHGSRKMVGKKNVVQKRDLIVKS